MLNKGRHPSFIGRSTMQSNAVNGGAMFYDLDGVPIAVSLINPHLGIYLAINVAPEHRCHGMAEAILNYLMPNFIRCINEFVPYFEKRGYRKIGDLKRGIRYDTQLLARDALFDLAGNLRKAWLK